MAFLRRLRLVLVAYPASATRTTRPFSKTNLLRQQVRVQDSRVLQQPSSRSAHTAHGAGRDPFLRFRSGLAVRESHELNLREGRRARLPANKTIQSFSRQLKDLRSVAPFAYQSDDGTRSSRWASPQRQSSSSTGMSDKPRSVKLYSTFGGTWGYSTRLTRPSATRPLSAEVSDL